MLATTVPPLSEVRNQSSSANSLLSVLSPVVTTASKGRDVCGPLPIELTRRTSEISVRRQGLLGTERRAGDLVDVLESHGGLGVDDVDVGQLHE